MNPEQEFGRKPSKRKVLAPKKNEEVPKADVKESLSSGKADGDNNRNESTEKKKPARSRSAGPPKKTYRRDSRSGRDQKPRGERPKKTDTTRRQPRKTANARTGRGGRSGMTKLSVVIPAYNEESNIEPLLNQFSQLFRNLPYKAEMILVNDGSEDRTFVRIKEHQSKYPWLKVFSHRNNRGLTVALETGFAKANGKIVCFYPADLQYHANEIPKLVSKLDSGADVVTGWKQGSYGIKSFGSFIYNCLSRVLFKVKVHDLNSIKAFKKEVAECFTYRPGWHRYMVVMAAQAGFIIDEVKVKLLPRKSGKSKFGLSQLPVGFLDLLSVKFELSFTKKPLLFFGSAGIISGTLGFITGLIALYLRFVENAGFRPLLYMVILLLVSGLLLFTIGFLAELIVSVKDDLSRKKIV
ncbi:MAG: glycosyltransferase [candidate division Zixibacteria bacterium]|nr:glycosyltransferase [candidate division Zixibacteria bacterium]